MEIDKETEEIMNLSVEAALFLAKDNLKVGDFVASKEDEFIYELREIQSDGNAIVGYIDRKTEKDVTRVFPLGQLFNIRVAKNIAMEIKINRMMKAIPNN